MLPYTPTKVIETPGFPDLRVTFRPPSLPEIARHENEIVSAARKSAKLAALQAKAKEGTDEYQDAYQSTYEEVLITRKAAFLAERIVGWDRTAGGHPVPCDLEGVLSLHYAVFRTLRDVMLGYAGARDAEDDAKKSPSQPA